MDIQHELAIREKMLWYFGINKRREFNAANTKNTH
jgi:hypothetical protein